MPPKNSAKGALLPVTTQTLSQAQTSNTSRTQQELLEPPFDHNDDGDPEGVDIAQLQEQIHTIARDRKDDRDLLGQILAQLTALTSAQTAQTPPQIAVHSIERDTSISTNTQDRTPRYSKKQPDPQPLSDRIDPTFESWKL
jgi:hypothetical protein